MTKYVSGKTRRRLGIKRLMADRREEFAGLFQSATGINIRGKGKRTQRVLRDQHLMFKARGNAAHAVITDGL